MIDEGVIVEIVRPGTGDPVAPGEVGEVVVTTLNPTYPLIRFGTGDLSAVLPGPCPSGRTNTRMARVSGRTDDMLIIRGVNVFPSQVESVLLMSPQVEPHYRLVVTRKGAMDNLQVEVEIKQDLYHEVSEAILSMDDISTIAEHEALVHLKSSIQKNVKDIIGINVGVTFKEPGSIERQEGKAQRVVDKRKEG